MQIYVLHASLTLKPHTTLLAISGISLLSCLASLSFLVFQQAFRLLFASTNITGIVVLVTQLSSSHQDHIRIASSVNESMMFLIPQTEILKGFLPVL